MFQPDEHELGGWRTALAGSQMLFVAFGALVLVFGIAKAGRRVRVLYSITRQAGLISPPATSLRCTGRVTIQ
jgi:hypothetical protein